MKKILTIAVITASFAYYACVAIMLAQAQTVSTGSIILAAGATTGTAGGTTIPEAPIPASEDNATDTVVAVLTQRVTAYASVPDETDDTPFVTADGSHVANGIAASNILPFGTRIEIPALFGDKIFTIHDRMSTRIKNTVDIWMPSVQKALVFGAEHAEVLVLSGNNTSTSIAML